MKQVYRLSLFLIVSAIAFAALALATQSIRIVQLAPSSHLTLGNPSGATTRTSKPDNFLMLKDQYALSFNNSNGGPNWVSWHLEKRDLGRRDRANDFRPDDSLPDDFTHVSYSDYAKTGFDSGHMCNSKDRTNTAANNSATFLMTNMLPQAPSLNRGPWKSVETFEQKQATAGNELYIIAGGFGTGGTGSKGRKTSIGGGKVNVPKTFWKVLVILPSGDNDLDRIDANTRTIAICMPNTQSVRGKKWQTFITTIRNVESATDLDLLSELPKRIQNALEAKRDSTATGRENANPCQ